MAKRNKIIYWISTIWLALGMVATGIQQLFHMKVEKALAPPGVFGITQLAIRSIVNNSGCVENFRSYSIAYSKISLAEGMGLRRLFLSSYRRDIFTYRNRAFHG